jgi:methenyltetrahydromethanopterin cyclohydrolase
MHAPPAMTRPANSQQPVKPTSLNERAGALCQRFLEDAAVLRIRAATAPCGAMLIDCGIDVLGGLEAGRRLAEICLSGLGRVQFAPSAIATATGLGVLVSTDHPLAACMASQYAGWQITGEKFFAMGSGPMRAAAAKEALFERIGHREKPSLAVGILEARKMPPDSVIRAVADDCGVTPDCLTLLVAPTASLAGTVQVVARSVETALHKLSELGFDLGRVISGAGTAPLPPAAGDDLAAIGHTNDAILYGAEVTLWVQGDDATLDRLGPRVPSSASPDHGRPFAAIFEHYGRDFYRIDPQLFSPAVVTLSNVDTGRSFRFGRTDSAVLAQSFAIAMSD